MSKDRSISTLLTGVCAATLLAGAIGSAQAPAPAPAQPAAQGPGRGGPGATNTALFTVFDTDKDGALTKAELRTAFGQWHDAAAAGKGGAITIAQLGTALNTVLPAPAAPAGGRAGAPGGRGRGAAAGPVADPVWGTSAPNLTEPCGGRGQTPTVACPDHVAAMMAALPATAPAKPARPRKVLIWSRIPAAGWQHSSIPIAAKTIEELGKKTGAWTSDTSWDPAVFTAENLKQYDAIFLSNTTGAFLDRQGDEATTNARRKALIDFVRGGKGVAGVHATGDSYHGGGGGAGRGGDAVPAPGGTLAPVIVRWAWGLNDRKLVANDLTMTKADMEAVANAWFDTVDTAKAGKVSQADFLARAGGLTSTQAGSDNPYVGAVGRDNGRGTWPDWDNMIGAFFKYHWYDGQKITVKLDDPTSPINAAFKGQEFDAVDEVYTFSMDTYSRKNLHILTSVNYDKMSFTDKLKESNPRADHDYALSWIKKDGQGRVFYQALGHNEKIFAVKPIVESLLAGMQYAIGDLEADDSPSVK